MQSELVPGYEFIFGKSDISYNDLLKDIPSASVIAIIITIQSETQVKGNTIPAQHAFLQKMSPVLSVVSEIISGLQRFAQSFQGFYNGFVFGKKYLLRMILKELKRNNNKEVKDLSVEDWSNVLKAYFLVCDEIHKENDIQIRPLLHRKEEPDFYYRILWRSMAGQYQFSESGDVSLEIFKLACLANFALSNYPDELKQFLKRRNQASVGKYIHFFEYIARQTEYFNPNDFFSRTYFLLPERELDHALLKSLCINNHITEDADYALIKKFPLYKDHNNAYRVIDDNFFIKKIYNGFMFDMMHTTDLKEKFSTNNYRTTVSKKVMEESVFQSILSSIKRTKHDVLKFDDSEDNIPDCYYRSNKTIFLIEFKDNMFPESLMTGAGYENIKEYVDDRFARNKKGSRKGIYQTIEQIKLLQNKRYAFDEKFVNHIYDKTYAIYPILCISEFHISLPGINQYLNEKFIREAQQVAKKKVHIKPLTIISLEVFYELYFRGYELSEMGSLIEHYWKTINNRKQKGKIDPMLPISYKFLESFDEVYFMELRENLKTGPADPSKLYKKLTEEAGIDIDRINKPM